MRDLFPDDPQLALFSQRFVVSGFDPTAIRPTLSPTQIRPKGVAALSIEHASLAQGSPHPSIAQPMQGVTNSPKRPLDDSDNESLHPRKIARSDSPLKGAAGRRLEAAKRTPLVQVNGPSAVPAPPTIPPTLMHWLHVLPKASSWNTTPFIPEKIAELIRNADLDRADLSGTANRPLLQAMAHAAPSGMPQPSMPSYSQYSYGSSANPQGL